MIARLAGLINQASIVHLLAGHAKAVGVPNDRFWLQADIQPPEIDVCFTPKSGHSEAHAGLPLLTHSRSQGSPNVTLYTGGFGHFVTSMTAPVAPGWSDGRVGLAPTEERRLSTAHTQLGQSGLGLGAIRLLHVRFRLFRRQVLLQSIGCN